MNATPVGRTTRGTVAILLVVAGLAAHGTPVASAASPGTLAGDGQIAYAKHGDIYTINPDGTGKTALVTDGTNYGPAWSPDGTQIAYVHADDTNITDLWIMNADGSGRTRLTTRGGVLAAAPSWSPDGSQLAYGGPCLPALIGPTLCHPPVGQWNPVLSVIDVTSVSGVGEVLITEPHGCYGDDGLVLIDGRTSWSPAGDRIAFYSNSWTCAGSDEFIMFYVLAEHDIDEYLMIGGGGDWGTLGNPAFSPDGALLAYDRDYGDVEGETHVGLTVVRLGIEYVRFRESENDRQLAFAPSQTRVALVRVPKDRIVLASMHGRHRSFLTRGSEPSWQPIG